MMQKRYNGELVPKGAGFQHLAQREKGTLSVAER